MHPDVTSTQPDGPHTARALARPVGIGAAERATLAVLSGLDAGRILMLEGGPLVIGSAAGVDLRVDDAEVSRRHAHVLRALDGTFFIEDLGSTNGTFVGGRRVERAPLASGDLVQIGPSLSLRFAVMSEADASVRRQLYESAVHDPLTRILNRRHLMSHLPREVERAARMGEPLALLMFDLDRFKHLNDTWGHVAGDQVLCAVVEQVARHVREQDLFARFGGDEFVVLLPAATLASGAALAERLRHEVASMRVTISGVAVSITVSIGIASVREIGPTDPPERLLTLADARLYSAKAQGRNRVCTA
jgi:diguanylate cyclase (GGDEF)-like protein